MCPFSNENYTQKKVDDASEKQAEMNMLTRSK